MPVTPATDGGALVGPRAAIYASAVLVLLPPSEGKAPARPGRRRPVDLDRLSWPQLRSARCQVLDALVVASARPDALTLLGLGPSLAEEVARNTRLREL